MYILAIFSLLVGTSRCANILGVFMYPSMNHQTVFQKIWKELALRGHHVTVVTPDPLNDPSLTTLTEISVRSAYEIVEKNDVDEILSKDSYCDAMTKYYHILDTIAEKELNSPQFRKLISNKKKKFDLILIEVVHPVMYALSARFKAPVIAVSSSSIFSVSYDAVGNPNHPVLYPDPIFNFIPGKLTIWEKFQSVYFFLWSKFYYHNVFVPRAHEMAEKYFGKDIPYIGDLERNVSMMFINTNLVIDPPKANVPAIVEISPIDVTPPKDLPDDLQKILDEAKEGVIYVNFEKNLTSVSYEKKLDDILQAFSELPYKVLWQSEADYLIWTSDNVVIRKWLPQRDILVHHNVKAFVTQGDQQSVEQAISNAVPLVCVPFTKEPRRVKRVVELGIGETITLKSLTKQELKSVIVKVAETKSYKDNIKISQSIYLDKPFTGLESAVWWAEYVIRHKGARHLRSAAVDMPWYEYLLIDVISFLIAVTLLVLYVNFKVLSLIPKLIKKMFKKKDTSKKKQN